MPKHQPLQLYPHLTFHAIPDEAEQHDRYWLAGYLEGEGYFALEKHVKSYATYFRPLVKINSTGYDVVAYAQHLLHIRYNTDVKIYSYQPSYKGSKITHTLRARGCKAQIIMQDIQPILGQRRQAKITKILAHTK